MLSDPHQSTVVDEIYSWAADPEGKWRLDTPDTGMECSRRPQLSACIMSPRSMPVRVLALRASQYINPIIISMDGTAMTG